MVREIWFEKSGSRKVVDQKKRWFYTINPHFFRLEKSGWPEKKIRVWRTTFLEPLFYTFPEMRSQNKRSNALAYFEYKNLKKKLHRSYNCYVYFSKYHLKCSTQLVKWKHTKLLCLTVPQWLLRVYVVCILASQKSGGMKIIPFDVVCLDINLRPDIKQKMMSLHSAPMHPSNQTYILWIYRCLIIKDLRLRLLLTKRYDVYSP